jgi:chromate reductase
MPLTIGYIVGSLSSTSINRRLSRALVKLAPEGVDLVEVPIKDLPFYSPDFDADYPPVARQYKDALAAVDGILLITPEYSRSIPGVLKNAIDWASRPYGTNSFGGKPTAVIGTSGGPIGAAIAQQHLKSILNHLDAPQLGQPEGFIQSAPGLFTDDGEVTNEATAEFLTAYLTAFANLITRHSAQAAA